MVIYFTDSKRRCDFMKSRKLNLAMIGLDTSHAPAFTRNAEKASDSPADAGAADR